MPHLWYLTKSKCSINDHCLNNVCVWVCIHVLYAYTSVGVHVCVCVLANVGMDGFRVPGMWPQRWLLNNLISKVRYDLDHSSMDHHWKCFLSFNGKTGVFTLGKFSLNLCQVHTQSTWFNLIEDRRERLLLLLFTNQWFPITIIGSSQPGTM